MDKEKVNLAEENLEAKEKFLRSQQCQVISKMIFDFIRTKRATSKEEALVHSVLGSEQDYDINLFQNIGFSLATSSKAMTIQSAIGLIASVILKGDREAQKVIDTHQVASELVYFTSTLIPMYQYNMFEHYYTTNGFLKVKFTLTLPEIADQKEWYPLPTSKPTKKHRELGKYAWKSTHTATVDKLNKTAFTVLDFDEPEPAKNTEDHIKWQVRKQLRPLMAGQTFYFNWHQDYRGRMYSGGYHFNPQGNNYEKSILAFATHRQVSAKGYRQVKYAVARAFGLDKEIDEKKLEWYEKNKNTLDWRKAKHPTEARAQLESIRLIKETGRTNIPVEIDATNSQLQMIACLMGDLKTAMTCNVITDNKSIQDAYKILAELMSNLLQPLKFDRGQIKKSMMIEGYGAGEKLIIKQLQEDLKEMFTDMAPQGFYTAKNMMSPASTIFKETCKSMWDSSKTQINVEFPNGFVMDYRPIQTGNIKVNPFGTGEIEMIAKICLPTARNTGLGVNIIHGTDAFTAGWVVDKHPNNDIWTIHDGYKVHPEDAEICLANYNGCLAYITDSEMLEDIIEQVTGVRIPKIQKQFTGEQVLTSKYSLS